MKVGKSTRPFGTLRGVNILVKNGVVARLDSALFGLGRTRGGYLFSVFGLAPTLRSACAIMLEVILLDDTQELEAEESRRDKEALS